MHPTRILPLNPGRLEASHHQACKIRSTLIRIMCLYVKIAVTLLAPWSTTLQHSGLTCFVCLLETITACSTSTACRQKDPMHNDASLTRELLHLREQGWRRAPGLETGLSAVLLKAEGRQ